MDDFWDSSRSGYAPNHIHVALRNLVSVNGTCRSADEVFRLL
jgi:hypothetical protein